MGSGAGFAGASRAICAVGVTLPLVFVSAGGGLEDVGAESGRGGAAVEEEDGGGCGLCDIFGLLDLRFDPKPGKFNFWNREFIKPAATTGALATRPQTDFFSSLASKKR